MKSLRIAMVAACPFPTSQGTQVFIGQLARALDRRGHQIHLLSYHYGDKNLRYEGRLHRLWALPIRGKLGSGPSVQKPLFDMLLVAQLDRLVRRLKADLIHAHNYEGLLVGLMVRRLRGIPVVFHTHNTMTHELPSYSHSPLGQSMARGLGRLLDAQLPRRADACIALTADIAAFVRHHGVAPEKLWVIPPAIEIRQFERGGKNIQDQQKDSAHLLYAGNLDAYQNFSLILESLPQVVAHYPRCFLEVVTNSSPERCLAEVDRMGLRERVHFTRTSSFDAVRRILWQCDLALCPRVSPFGFPIKLLNYLAAGKPVVICQGSADGIRHLVDGWVVPDDDVGGFSEAIVTLLKDASLRRKLSENARMTAREKFSWDRLAPSYEQVYRRTLQSWRA